MNDFVRLAVRFSFVACVSTAIQSIAATVVAPNAFANSEANGYSGGLGSVLRMQEVYGASHFPTSIYP